MSYNGLGDEGAKNLGASLLNLQSLNNLSLDLGDNGIGVQGAKNLGASL